MFLVKEKWKRKPTMFYFYFHIWNCPPVHILFKKSNLSSSLISFSFWDLTWQTLLSILHKLYTKETNFSFTSIPKKPGWTYRIWGSLNLTWNWLKGFMFLQFLTLPSENPNRSIIEKWKGFKRSSFKYL